MNLTVKIGRDEASPLLARIHAATTPARQRDLMNVVGVAAEQELHGWFYQRDATTPNKQGWHREHFWERIRRATAFDPAKTTPTTATVVCVDPALAAKIDGATIKPTEGRKALSIPLRDEAYGVQPRSGLIPGLFVFRVPELGAAYLAAERNKRLVFFYRFVPQAVVPKDPAALPPEEQTGAALGAAAQAWWLRAAEGKN